MTAVLSLRFCFERSTSPSQVVRSKPPLRPVPRQLGHGLLSDFPSSAIGIFCGTEHTWYVINPLPTQDFSNKMRSRGHPSVCSTDNPNRFRLDVQASIYAINAS